MFDIHITTVDKIPEDKNYILIKRSFIRNLLKELKLPTIAEYVLPNLINSIKGLLIQINIRYLINLNLNFYVKLEGGENE